MNSEYSEIHLLLERIADNLTHVLDLDVDRQREECALRGQLRQRAKRYTVAVGSRLEQAKRHRDEPDIDWQYLDFSNALSRRRLSQPGFDVVLLPSAPDDLAPWQQLLRHGGWLIAGSAGRWQSWQHQPASVPPDPFPLTDIQHAYWIGRSQSLALGGVSCHVYFEWWIEDFNLPLFESAWNRVIARHGMMRACVDHDGLQRILPQVPHYAIAIDDLRALTTPERDARLKETRREMCEQVLDASRWPLFDLRASQQTGNGYRIHLDLDLLTFDVQSFHIVLAELARFYRQPALTLPPIHYSFRDYQLDEAQARKQSGYADDRAWWLARLDQLHPAPQLPLRCQPSAVAHPEFRRLQRRIEPERWQRLSGRAAAAGITPSAMLLAAFSELLTLWSEEPRFTLNLTHFNRRAHHPDVAQLVGDFTSVLLLSIDCSTAQPFCQRAEQVQQMLWERLAHSRFGGVDVLREWAKRHGRADSSAMPIVFTSLLGMDLDTLVDGADLLGEPAYLYTATPQVWLDHQVMVRKGSLEYNWIVIDNLFPSGMIDTLFAAWGDLLDRLTDDDLIWRQPLQLPLPAEEQAVREAVNRTAKMLPCEPLHAGFFRQAQRHPQAIALIAGDTQWTYQQLAQQALRVASRLAESDCYGQPVIVSLPKGAPQIIAALGVMAAGAILVPAASDWPLARLHDVIEQSQAVALIAADDCLSLCPMTDGVSLNSLPQALATPVMPPLTQIAYIIYTSGSTGKPKGVAMAHAATANTLTDVSERLALNAQDRVFGLSSLSFDLAIFDLFATLTAGAALVLPQQDGMRDAAHWLTLLRQHRVTCWNSVPSLMAMLVAHLQAHSASLPDLRNILLSGDWIGWDLVARIPAVAPAARLIALGGATEAAIWSNWYDIDPLNPRGNAVPYGYPLANQRYAVLDAQGRDRPAGVAGELYIAGVGLASGYWRDPERTSAAFIDHAASQQRLYRTGDLACYDAQGCIEFLGRRDAQVKVGGHRIELGEIEAALLAEEPVLAAVADVVKTPSGAQQLAAWLVIAPGDSAQETLLEAGHHAAERLPEPTRLASLAAFQTESESLAPLMMLHILQQMNFLLPEGWRIETRIKQLRIAPCFRRLLTRWHHSLEEQGLLEQQQGEWRLGECAPTALALEQRLDDGKHRLRQFLTWLDNGPLFADWLFASSSAIETVLHEPQLASSLLFPEGDSRASEALYQGNIIADYLGSVAARLLETAVGENTAAQVMEIGAGIGGLTASTLPAFAALAAEGTYLHTDVSPWFTHYAEQRFGEYDALRTGRYDINQPAAAQGYEQGSMDAILAANVLHNAHRPEETLGDIYQMLKPGACLLLLEATQDKELQWVTAAAVLEHAAEGGASHRDSPLLSETQWRELLTAAGFALIDVWPHAGTPMAFTGQQLFLACRPQPAISPEQLHARLALRLPGYMLPDRLIAVAKLPLSANGKIDRKKLPQPAHQLTQRELSGEAPQTPTEQRLAALWCQLLRVNQVSRQQDFFTAGGDSLLATRLATQLSAEWGQQVPIRLIFTHSTLQQMARELARLTQPALTPPLIELNEAGPHKLICLHASDGFATPYQRLAAALNGQLQCIGLEASGLTLDEAPIEQMEQQAARAIGALRRQSIDGPWHLAGWSMGAWLAMEMAYQLQLAGEQVASLTLIDPAPQAAMRSCADSEYNLWQSMATEALTASITTFDTLTPSDRLACWRRVLPSELEMDDALLQRLIATLRANVQAMVSAPRRTLDIPARVVLASHRQPEWGSGEGGLDDWFGTPPDYCVIADSNHQNIITQPTLFTVLQQAILPTTQG